MMHQGPVFQQPPPPPPTVGNPVFRQYNRHHPPEFNGYGEPQEAKRWLKQMEKNFRMTASVHSTLCIVYSSVSAHLFRQEFYLMYSRQLVHFVFRHDLWMVLVS